MNHVYSPSYSAVITAKGDYFVVLVFNDLIKYRHCQNEFLYLCPTAKFLINGDKLTVLNVAVFL